MTAFPASPRLLKGGLVLLDPETGAIQRIIELQYNPDTLTRTLQAQSVGGGGEGAERSDAMRLKGPPIETIKLEAEIDATDKLEHPDQNPNAANLGIQPQLAALETIIYPSSGQIVANNVLQQVGMLEIVPMQGPLVLFAWSQNRIVPVRITEFSITEEAFDPSLNPIRAKVNLGLRVLNINDLGVDSKGGNLYLAYQRQKEQLANKMQAGSLSSLGIGGLP